MAKNHGARQQKKAAKQKAKRASKRATLSRRDSTDPTIRLQGVSKKPIVHAFGSEGLWDDGIGTLVLTRLESEGRYILGNYMVDAYCMGVKNAFWDACGISDIRDMREQLEEMGKIVDYDPACLAKIVLESIEYAKKIGIAPHPDYRHAGKILQGIDVATCPNEYEFGKDGKPLYISGPYDDQTTIERIFELVRAAGGSAVLGGPIYSGDGDFGLDDFDDEDDFDAADDDQGGDPDETFEAIDDDGDDIVIPSSNFKVVSETDDPASS